MVILLTLWAGWYLRGQSVRITVDGMATTIHTHRRTVADLLPDLRLWSPTTEPLSKVRAAEMVQVSVPLESMLALHPQILIQRAHPWQIWIDGRETNIKSWKNTPQTLLADAGIQINDDDTLRIDDQAVAMDMALAAPNLLAPSRARSSYIWQGTSNAPRQIHVNRAVPITIDDGGKVFAKRIAAQNVGQALQKSMITLRQGDHVEPDMSNPLQSGLKIVIQRSTPINVQVDGQLITTGILARTVADALAEIGIAMADKDQVTPRLTDGVYENMEIEVIRVREDVESVDVVTSFETIFRPDINVPIDTRQVINQGADGIRRTRYRIRYENGLEVSRILEDKWLAQEPTPRVIAYGQRIVPRTALGPAGETITYWRKIRMLATSYSASTSGTSRDKPWYGHTYTGDKMRHGIVAVDPDVVPLRSKVYVPGYGYGDALDIGGAIVAKHIDLGYDDDNLVIWRKWVDVYLLWPPPPSHQITWVIRDWPPEQ